MNLYRILWPQHTRMQYLIVARDEDAARYEAYELAKTAPILLDIPIQEIVLEHEHVHIANKLS